MSDSEAEKVANVATTVMKALQDLSPEERSRVILSVAALFGVTVAPGTLSQKADMSTGDKEEETNGPQGPGAPIKQLSLVELLKEKTPATNVQRIACFAYYREKYEGIELFESNDLAAYFAKARLPSPGSNYLRDYKKAVQEAWIHDDGSKSYLTQGGERSVEAGFDGKRRSPTARSTRRRKGRKG